MIVEVGVGDSDPISTMGNVEKTIKVILSKAQVTRQIAVVNPHIGRLIDTNSVAVGSIDLGDLEVAENNVLLLTNIEANTSDSYASLARLRRWQEGGLTASSSTDDSLVRCRSNLVTARQLARDDNGERFSALSSFDKSSDCSDSDSRALGTASGTTVLGAVSDGARLRSLAL